PLITSHKEPPPIRGRQFKRRCMSKASMVIQLIKTLWTKKSRGGQGARQRNSVPTALRLPMPAFAAPFFLHRIDFSQFANVERRESLNTAMSLIELRI